MINRQQADLGADAPVAFEPNRIRRAARGGVEFGAVAKALKADPMDCSRGLFSLL